MKVMVYYFFIFFTFFVCNFLLFSSFEGIPNYRDFVGSEYFYNINNSLQIGTAMRYIVNFLFQIGVDIIIFYKILFSLYFTFSLLFIFLGIKKYSRLLDLKDTYAQKIFLFLLSLFSVYNPWVFERVLMGQLGVMLGYSLFFLNIGFLFEICTIWKKREMTSPPLTKPLLFFTISLLCSLFVSPHYPILIIIILGIYFLHTFLNSFFYKIDIKKILFQFIFITFPSFCFLAFRYLGESQYSSFSQSLHQNQILENFSLWEETPYFFITSVTGGNSWMSNGFIEKINISRDLGFLNLFSLGFYPLLGLIFFAFVLFIYFSVIRLYIEKYCIYKNTLLVFSLLAFPLALILNFGLSGGLEFINKYVYEIPFSYIFRESGKFYALVLISLSIIILGFWKMMKKEMMGKYIFSQENMIIIFFCFFFSGFFPFLYLAKNLNQPIYPEIYKNLQEECSPDEKILFLPLSQYSLQSYSPSVFMVNPDRYLFPCSRLDYSFAFLGDKNIKINNDDKNKELEKLVLSLSRHIQKEEEQKIMNDFLNLLGKNNVNYLIIDTFEKNKTLTVFNNLVKYIKVYKSEGNIFIFKIMK